MRVDPITLQTSHPKIWAGGDVAKGPRNLIDAIADGRRGRLDPRCARRRASRVATRDRDQHPSGLSPSRQRLRRHPAGRRAHDAHRSSHRLRRGRGGLRRNRRHARVAALLCVASTTSCSTPSSASCAASASTSARPTASRSCADRVGVGAETQSALLLEEDRCIRCALCVNRCPPGALSMVYAREVERA